MKKIYYAATLTIMLLCFVILTGCTKYSAQSDAYDQLKEKGKLIVGTSTDYKPMEYHDEKGEIVGLDIDIANEIANSLGLTLEVKDMTWQELFDAAKAGEIDLAISSITITAERSETLLFSTPYFNAGQVIVVRKDNGIIKGPLDLGNKRLVVETGTTGEGTAREYTNTTVITYPNTPESPFVIHVKEDLSNLKADAAILDYIAAISMVNDNTDLKIVGEPFTQEFYGLATKKSNVALMDEVNKILRTMKREGKLDELTKRWSNK